MSGRKTINQTTPAIGAIKIQQSTYGLVLPIVWGRTRISGNLMWYGDFKAVPHTEVTQQGGKGGGAPRQTSTTYSYTASVAMLLCEGPIMGVNTCWRGKNIYGGTAAGNARQRAELNTTYAGSPINVGGSNWANVSVLAQADIDYQDDYKFVRGGAYVALVEGVDYTASAGVYTFTRVNVGQALRITYTYTGTTVGYSVLSALGMDLRDGTPGQAPWSYLTSAHPSEALGYSGIAYLVAANYALDDAAGVENHAFEITSALSYSATIPDANPAAIAVDALSNPHYGSGFGLQNIGVTDDYANACAAQGIFLSPALTEQSSAAAFLDALAALTNVGLVWSGNTLKFIPYTDTQITGNGVTFTPNTAPIYDLTDDDFLPGDDEGPVKVTRGSVGDSFNSITLEYMDRANAYNLAIMTVQDQADIQENGLRQMSTISAHWIVDGNVANIVANLILQRSMFIRNTYEFKLNWTKVALEPMDLVTLTDPVLMTKQPVRILTMEEADDGSLSFVAEDFPKGSASATRYPTATGIGFAHNFNELPGECLAPVIFEAPAALASLGGGLELWLACGSVSPTYGGCEVWTSLTGANYQRAAVLHGSSRYGTTTSALSASTAGAQTTETLGVQLNGGATLSSATAADMVALSTLCWVGNEFFAYENATLTGSGAYTIGNHLVRGAYLSPAASHAANAPFVRCDALLAKLAVSPDYIGKTIYVKVLPFNRYGGSLGDIAAATAYTYNIIGVQANSPPAAPTGLALEGPFTIKTAKVKWGAVPNAKTYNVRVYSVVSGNYTLVREVNIGDALRFDYSSGDAQSNGGPWRSLRFMVQGINANGAGGAFATLDITNPQVGAIGGINASGGIKSIFLTYATPVDADFVGVQVWLGATANFTPGAGNLIYDGNDSLLVFRTLADKVTELVGGTTYYLVIAGYDDFGKDNLTLSGSIAVTPSSAALDANSITAAMLKDGILDATKFASGIEPVTLVASVPTTKSTATVFNTTDGKLYRWNGSAYVASVAATDVSGVLPLAQIPLITAPKFDPSIEPVTIVSSVPSTKSTSAIFNNADGKLYRWDGSAYRSAVAVSDIPNIDTSKITTGTFGDAFIGGMAASKLTTQITATNITDRAISTVKIAAGAITANEILANTITANQIASRTITAANIISGAITANEIMAGTLTATQIAARTITAGNLVSGTITANEIAAGTITGDRIAANTITASQIAANTITASQIAADTITASQIAANAITASELSADAVTAGKIAAGAISARELQAGAITTDKLAVTSKGAAINPDPFFADPKAYGTPANTTFANITDGVSGNRVIRSLVQPFVSGGSSLVFPLTAGKVYRAQCRVRAIGNGTTAYFRCGRQNSATGLIAYALYNSSGAAYEGFAVNTGAWQTWESVFTAEAGTVQGYLEWDMHWTNINDGRYMEMQDMRLEEVLPGTLIQDGAITTQKMTAASINGDRITANTLNADRIMANTITADKMNVNSLSAISGNFGNARINSGGGLMSGAYTSYAWPSSGTGFFLGESGLLFGNPNTGKYAQFGADGYQDNPGFELLNGVMRLKQQVVGTNNLFDNATKAVDVYSQMSSYSNLGTQNTIVVDAKSDILIICNIGHDSGSGTQGYNVEYYNGSGWSNFTSNQQEGVGSSLLLTGINPGTLRLMSFGYYGVITNVVILKFKK